MALPLLGLAGSLFGGGGSQTGAQGATAGPIANTTGDVSFGSKFLGRGAVTSTDSQTEASGGSSIVAPATPAPNNTPLYVAAGVGVLVVALVLTTRGKG